MKIYYKKKLKGKNVKLRIYLKYLLDKIPAPFKLSIFLHAFVREFFSILASNIQGFVTFAFISYA